MSDSVSALCLLIHRERKRWGERGREKRGKAVTRNGAEREIYRGRNGRKSSNEVREGKKRQDEK